MDLKRKFKRDSRFPEYLEFVDNPGFQNTIRSLDDYVAVFNRKDWRYEIHCLGIGVDTLCLVVPWDRLDVRTVERLYRTSVKFQGDVGKKMREHNAKIKASKDRDFKNEIDAISWETAKDVGYAAEKDDLHDGYKRTHVVQEKAS